MPLQHYLHRDGEKLRFGYTTGTCAALAAQAAAIALLSGNAPRSARLITPKGLAVEVEIEDVVLRTKSARCAVRKDGGDDIDATHGLLIYAEVAFCEREGIQIDGGEGVGRVTRPGLEQPVGAAAINSVPRRMIREQIEEICQLYDYHGGLAVLISVPGGEEVAAQTFNPQLGIVGGISILGTSGIVEPRSLQALIDTIETEMKMLAAEGKKQLIVTPGNYGEDFALNLPYLQERPILKCSNFLGDTLDLALALDFEQLLLIGHIGKLVKLAGGIMNTHSRYADGRTEIFTAYAALAGADQTTAEALMNSVTSDACLDILDEKGLRETVMHGILASIQKHLDRRVKKKIAIGAVLFSNQHGLLGESSGARAIIAAWQAITPQS